MNSLISLLLFILFSVNAYSQYAVGTAQKINELKNKTLTVVLYKGENDYNNYIEEIITEKWIYGKFEFVQYENLPEKFENPALNITIQRRGTSSNSFSVPVLEFSMDKDFYAMVQLEYNKYEMLDLQKAAGLVNDYSKERLELLVQVILNNLAAMEKGTLTDQLRFDYSGKTIKEYYNKSFKVSDFRTATLYLPKGDVAIRKPMGEKTDDQLLQPGAIGEIYKGKYEIADEEELAKAITEKKKGAYYLHTSIEGSVILYLIVDLETQKVAYLEGARGNYGDVTCWKGMLKDLNKLAGFK